MTEALFRPSTPEDMDAVQAVLLASYPVFMAPLYDASVLSTALPVITRAQPALVASGTYWVGERAGQVLAVGGWTQAAPGRADAVVEGLGHVRHVAVHPKAGGQGLGRALMGAVMAQARAQGMRRLRAWSTLNAVPFYRALGFEDPQPLSVLLGGGTVLPSMQLERAL